MGQEKNAADELDQLLAQLHKESADNAGVDNIPSAAPSGPADGNEPVTTPNGDNTELGDKNIGGTVPDVALADPLVPATGVTVGDSPNPPCGGLGVNTAAPSPEETEIKTASEYCASLDAAAKKHGIAKVAAAVLQDFDQFIGGFCKSAGEEAAIQAGQQAAALEAFAKFANEELDSAEAGEGGDGTTDSDTTSDTGDDTGAAVINDMQADGLTDEEIGAVIQALQEGVSPEQLAAAAGSIDGSDVDPAALEAALASDPDENAANSDAAVDTAEGVDDQADAQAQTLAALVKAQDDQASQAIPDAGDPASPEVAAMSAELASSGVTPEELAGAAGASGAAPELKTAAENLCSLVNMHRNLAAAGRLKLNKSASEVDHSNARALIRRILGR